MRNPWQDSVDKLASTQNTIQGYLARKEPLTVKTITKESTMKAKDLIKILQNYPEADVIMDTGFYEESVRMANYRKKENKFVLRHVSVRDRQR